MEMTGYIAAVRDALVEVDKGLASFDADPADNQYQKDYERGLKDVRLSLLALLPVPQHKAGNA